MFKSNKMIADHLCLIYFCFLLIYFIFFEGSAISIPKIMQ